MARPLLEVAANGRGRSWLWGLLLVAALHLLTTPGTWLVTDQAEALFTAWRLVTRGTLTLGDRGVARVSEVPWAPGRPGEPIRSRLLPGPALALAPLLALDRALGLEDPLRDGRLVHLQGHLFVLAALALAGWTVRRRGASSAAAAAAVVLGGLAWPVWMISRRGGAEPILAFLVLAFIAGAELRHPRARGAASGLALAALPWVNPMGTVLLATLLGVALGEQLLRRPRGPATEPALLVAAGVGSVVAVVVVWNHLYHGNWWAGGYVLVGGGSAFGAIPALEGLIIHLLAILEEAPLLIGLAVAGVVWRRGPSSTLLVPLALLAATLALFSTYYFSVQPQEPARRLAVVWPAWALAVGSLWDRLRLRAEIAEGLLATGGLLGFAHFMWVEGRYYLGPGGLYYPSVLWVKRAIDLPIGWGVVMPPLVLLALTLLAAIQLARLLRESRPLARPAASARGASAGN